MDHADGARSGSLPGMGGGTAGSPSVLLSRPTITAGAAYAIDVEHVPQAIADLRRAAQALTQEARKASGLANITPPGLDVVSAHAVEVFAEVAAGERGSLRVALLGAAARFRSEADKLEASLREYLHTDEINIPVARELTGVVPMAAEVAVGRSPAAEVRGSSDDHLRELRSLSASADPPRDV